jgi:hypothetical protein
VIGGILQTLKNRRAGARKARSLEAFRRQLADVPPVKDPFYVVAMPGGLHLTRLAIEYMPAACNAVLVLNGTDEVESEWARREIPACHVARVDTVLPHWQVLDALFDTAKGNFGILDYDCYVFDASAFPRIADIDDTTAMNGYFFRHNDELDIDTPETFFLFFNLAVVNRLRRQYGVGAAKQRWHTLPENIKAAMARAPLAPDQYPETHKPYFDTLRVLMMLSVVENVPYRFVGYLPASPHASDEAFHVGGVSDPESLEGIWALRGSYFWYRVLEDQRFAELRSIYAKRFRIILARELLAEHEAIARKIDPEFFDMCERIVTGDTPRSVPQGPDASLPTHG